MKNVLLSNFLLWSGFVFSREITVAWIGVPINVLFACAVGTAAAFAMGEKIESRKQLWTVAFFAWLMGATITGLTGFVLTYFFEDLKMTDAGQAGMGAVVSYITRFLLPWLAEVIKTGKWVAWIPFLNKAEK